MSHAPLPDPDRDAFLAQLIKRKVRQLLGRAGFTPDDRDYLRQELYACAHQSLAKFDNQLGHQHAYLTTVLNRHVARLLRYQRAGKRDPRRVTSLNITIGVADEGPVELAQTISDRQLDARLCRTRRAPQELTALALDIDTLWASLPEMWQALLERYPTQSLSEISRELGVPRTTLNDRARFGDIGLIGVAIKRPPATIGDRR